MATPFTRQEIASARRKMRVFGCDGLLSGLGTNPKTAKNDKKKVLTIPLHLAPYNSSGYQVCPLASKGCAMACLNTAGNPTYLLAKMTARLARTHFFFEDRENFMRLLYTEIAAHERLAAKHTMDAGIRLNATSDISWEVYKVPGINKTIFDAFPSVRFYDYTKIYKRVRKFLHGKLPANYYLTFSASEDNELECFDVLKCDGTVAMVFDIRRNQPMITQYKGYPVIDGDVHDYRPSDRKGCIIGLRMKGKAHSDKTGFVHKVAHLPILYTEA